MSAPENQAAHSSSTPCNTLPVQWSPYNHPLIDPYSGNLVYGAHYWLLVPGVGSVKAPQGYQRDFPHEDQAPVPALQAAAQTQARYRTAV